MDWFVYYIVFMFIGVKVLIAALDTVTAFRKGLNGNIDPNDYWNRSLLQRMGLKK